MILGLWYHNILATLFGLIAVLLMGIILLQRGKGVGLSGAFGGAGGHTAFGAKTGDVLTWATIIAAIALLTFAVVLNYVFVPPTPFPTATPAAQAPLAVPTEDAGADAPLEIPVESPPPVAPAPAGGGEAPEITLKPDDPARRLCRWRPEIFSVEIC